MEKDYLFMIVNCIRGCDSCCEKVLKFKKQKNKNFINTITSILKKIEYEDGGWCVNDEILVRARDGECSVGMVRKDRDRIIADSRTCETCPYFISKNILKTILNGSEEEFRKVLIKRILFLYTPNTLKKKR